jgi:hypothetical protein
VDRSKRNDEKIDWTVDEAATTDDLLADPEAPLRPPEGGGRVVFVDESGAQRRLPPNLGELSRAQRDAALSAMSRALGAGPQDYAKTAAIERLTELRAAGKISDEKFERERRRLENY